MVHTQRGKAKIGRKGVGQLIIGLVGVLTGQ